MVPLQKARQILNDNSLSDVDLQNLIENLTLFATVIIDQYQTQKYKTPSQDTSSEMLRGFSKKQNMGYPCRDFREGNL